MAVSFRYAVREGTSLILDFIKALAEYEKMSEQVVATPELMEEWTDTALREIRSEPWLLGAEIALRADFRAEKILKRLTRVRQKCRTRECYLCRASVSLPRGQLRSRLSSCLLFRRER